VHGDVVASVSIEVYNAVVVKHSILLAEDTHDLFNEVRQLFG
jgi:hypothetical protein